MGLDQEQSFTCEICTKTFVKSRCLGAHMRCHVTKNTNFSNMGFEDCNDSSFGLRENPKGKWRYYVSGEKQSNEVKTEHICKQCGRRFISIRALFGHMRCHSVKRPRISIQSSGLMQRGFDNLRPIKKKRSKLRYKASGFGSSSDFSSRSKLSDFDENEQGALNLMMLSSGFTKWADFVSGFECSGNDPLILKAKAIYENSLKLGKGFDSRVSVSERNGAEFGNFDYSCLDRNGEGLKDPVMGDDFGIKFSNFEIGKNDIHLGMDMNYCDPENVKKSEFNSKSRTSEHTSSENQIIEFGENRCAGKENTDSVCNVPRNRCDDNSDKIKTHDELSKNSKGHDCEICFKSFSSGRALGGHKRAHFNGFPINKSEEGVVINQESVDDFSFGKNVISDLVPEQLLISS